VTEGKKEREKARNCVTEQSQLSALQSYVHTSIGWLFRLSWGGICQHVLHTQHDLEDRSSGRLIDHPVAAA
jgi:hypothetical protein